ncbi:MAG: DegQ family serine endoprotease [Gammaproteobacteria bacterium]|nr:DegQ family serine endoprotease [Gammaproteobacteria bacterium]MBI5615451.1 DegQ family serine endoprotease [Gammaproteobacteria bacterium]
MNDPIRARRPLAAGLLAAALVAAPNVTPAAEPPAALIGNEMPSLAPMLEKVTPAVVNIAAEGHVKLQANPLFNDPFFRRFFNVPDMPRERKTASLGSGFIVDAARGLVLTNNHVIADADQISVKLTDGRKLQAELVGTDPDTDVAVVRIKAGNLTALPMGDSDRLRVGDYVVAIGNPFGLGQTVTSGIVSALARSGLGITGYEDLIQTDASINPGNSGGALVNLRGEVVGINTAIFSKSGGNIGIGFAIPIDMAHRIMEQLVEFGEVRRGFVGAQMQDLDPDLAAAFGLPDRHGAVLVNILPDSPAAKAGLKPGDVVTAVNGKPVRDAASLRNTVGLMRIGEPLQMEYLRDGKKLVATAEVGKPAETKRSPGLSNKRLSGATVGDISEESPAYGNIEGVMVFAVEPGSSAWKAGLREGDIITSLNRQPISELNSFLALANQIKGPLLLGVQRGEQSAFIAIK